MKQAFVHTVVRMSKLPNTAVWRTRVIRALLIVTTLLTVMLILAQCEFDGGLLDENSEASRENAEQLRAAAQAAADRVYFAEHKADVHTDMVTFAASLCSATEAFRAALPASSDETMPIDAAFGAVRTDLAVIGHAARDAHDFVAAVAVPVTDRVLTPGTDAATWVNLRDRASGAFGDVANSVDGIEDRLHAAQRWDADAATAELRGANDAIGYQLTVLAATVNDVLARLPIANQETLDALHAAEVCGPAAA